MVKKAKPKKETKHSKEELTKEELAKRDQKLRVLGLFLLLFGLFLLFSFLSWFQSWKVDYNFADTVFKHFSFSYFFDKDIHVENWMGKTGTLVSYLFITKWFGVSSLFFVIMILVIGTRLFFHYTRIPVSTTLKYSFFGILWLPVFLGLLFPSADILGGVYGYQMNLWLMEYLGFSGLILLLIFTGLSFSILAFNIPFRWIKPSAPKTIKQEDDLEAISPEGSEEEEAVKMVDLPVNTFKVEPPGPLPSEDGFLPAIPHADIELQIEHPTGESDETPIEGNHYGIDTLYDPTLELKNYKFPPLKLLSDYGSDALNVNKDELEANKDKIVETLGNYDIRIQKIKATIGPAVTLYEIVPEAGVRISRIKNLEDDIALGLAALGIRIIAPIPGRGTIGIEVPNQNPEIVSIKSLLASEKFRNSPFELPFVLGKTISNETFIADLTRMPHLLMAGATGQGKSVGLNAIITSFLYKKHPATVKFVLIDPKKVELTLYSKIERHYLAKLPDSEDAIITDTKKVIRTLNSLNIEMDSRYDLLRDAQVRNVKEYNEKFLTRKLNPNDGHKFLPYIVVVIDEFADLIMTAGREIETPLTRLAQLARATGIHLIIATQRPSVNIITGTIKANFPARIAFRVISKIDSRTILDSSGADQLIGRGDMLLSTGSDLIRLQCAFVDTPEVDQVTEYIGSQRGYPDAFHLPEYYDEENGSGKEFDPNERDELFTEAARLVTQHQHGSTSLIQRKLKLGYNRAGRIIDQLESAGIVGHFEGSKAREVKFKDLGALEEYLNNMTEN
ncbi:MAG: DNA translocase FtsK 4TM domain-containing protein [Bacteroidales bacterium]|nr:DNA translocase FtsK 4TM domain-containing protein [Bacteroidales bacterium]